MGCNPDSEKFWAVGGLEQYRVAGRRGDVVSPINIRPLIAAVPGSITSHSRSPEAT